MNYKEFKRQWAEKFCRDIDPKIVKKYVLKANGYIWNIFAGYFVSKEKYTSGDEAIRIYNGINKERALVCDEQIGDELFEITDEYKNFSSDDCWGEIYIVAHDFSWTFICTHEKSLGPYFMKIE